MHILYFTERDYHYDPETEPEKHRRLENAIIRERSFFGTPNRLFDPQHAAQLFDGYLQELAYADEVGFDGVMLNEHHATPFCMGAVMDVEAAILARITKKVNIVLLGNPVATTGNPLRMAEELAMIDLISGGRLVSGWVRGAGCEQLANNANPAFNRELFEEGVDFITKAWTTPGPFRYEGKHYHFRHVNPWVLPLQKPHPPFWIPGLVSPDTVVWCAKRRYPYVAMATKLAPTLELWKLYTEVAASEGYQAGPENFGYLQAVFVGDNQERAEELGKRYLFGGSFAHFARPEWMFPPGYNSKEATRRLAQLTSLAGKPIFEAQGEPSEVQIEEAKKRIYDGYQGFLDDYAMIAGTPDVVIKRIRQVLEVLRPGIFVLRIDGPMSFADRRRAQQLMAAEVIPAMREMAKEMGLVSPFERKPGSRALAAGVKPEPMGSPEALAALRP